jgi:fatty acid desaturase
MDMHRDQEIERRALTPAQLKEFSERSNMPGAVRSIGHFGAVALVGTIVWRLHANEGLIWAMPFIPVQGFLVAFLFMPMHEAAHKTVFSGRVANEMLGHVCALAIVFPFQYYTLFHWDHHRFTQDPKRDPELVLGFVPTSDAKLAIAYTGILQLARRTRLLLRHAIIGNATAPWIPEHKRRLVVMEARAYAAVYLALLLGSLALSTTALLWTWLVPLALGQLFLRPYLYAEHTGCGRTRSAFENTRTTYTGALIRWFAWNMPFHVEHHAYPSVPFHALPRLNEVLAERIVFRGRGYRAVTRETWNWFRRARQNGDRAQSA